MPVYEYDCADCGGFTALRAISERDAPQPCSRCALPARRLIRTAPVFPGLAAAVRRAYAVNERAAHEPRRVSAAANPAHDSRPTEPAVRATCGRPWMIGH